MTRFLLLNFEDFGLNQDITKTIQPFNPFCICCLDREGPMYNLDKCQHSDYIDALVKPQLKHFNQLVCLQCHSLLKKIKCFQQQILESCDILLSGEFTDTTTNKKRLHSLFKQKVVYDLHLPSEETKQPDFNKTNEDIANSIQDNFTTQLQKSLHENFTHAHHPNTEENFAQEFPNDSNMEINFTHELPNDSNMAENFTHELSNDLNEQESFAQNIPTGSNMEEHFSVELSNCSHVEENKLNLEDNFVHSIPDNSNIDEKFSHSLPESSNIRENFTHSLPVTSNIEENFASNLPDSLNIVENYTHSMPNTEIMEDNLVNEENRLNKNIKTALEILERNNQSFLTIGSQLQFLNGGYLSFLEPSLLSKEILTDIPLVPAKSLSTDLDNGLLNSTKSLDIEIDEPEKMFYDSLDLCPDLMQKEANTPEIIVTAIDSPTINNETEPKLKPKKKLSTSKQKKRSVRKQRKVPPSQIKTVKLSQDELNRERVLQAQSDAYLRYKFRCETCIVGFNYKENLEDHIRRKHGPVEGANIVCDICSQVIPTPGSVTEHKYRHYTRYECVQCNIRYHTHDEAIRHSTQNKCSGDISKANGFLKLNYQRHNLKGKRQYKSLSDDMELH